MKPQYKAFNFMKRDFQWSLESFEKILKFYQRYAPFCYQCIIGTLILPKKRSSEFSHKKGRFGNLRGVLVFFFF